MNTNLRLALVAVLLLAASIWTYSASVSRGERFQRGQRLLPNLVPDEVATITLEKGETTTTLKRSQDDFVVAEVHNYPAKNEAVNRVLHDLVDATLEKEVGRSSDLAAELEIDPPGEETIEIALLDSSGEDMVRLRVGKSFESGAGRYVRRTDLEDAPIYLTSAGLFLNTDAASFLEKEIVDMPQERVRQVKGPDYVLERREKDGPLELASVPAGRREKAAETGKLASLLDRFSFEQVFLADDPEVRDLDFGHEVTLELDDGTSYTIAYADHDDHTFVTVRGDHDLERVEIGLDTPEDELREKADKLSRADEIEDFNAFNGSWVYQVSSYTADKLRLRRADLLEDAT